jgi:cysteine synthase A
MGPGHTIATVICDSGDRYKSKLFNEEFLKSKGLEPKKYLNGDIKSFLVEKNSENQCEKQL